MISLWSTIKTKVSDIWNKSWTKFLAWSQGVVAAGSALFMGLGSYITDPTIKAYLDGLSLPTWANLSLATMAVITYIAHGHEADK